MESGNIALYAFRKYGDTALQAAFCCTGSRQDAEDIAEAVFLAMHDNPPSFAGDAHLKAYIIRTVIRLSGNLRHSFWHRLRTAVSPDKGPDAEDSSVRVILRIIASLPPEQSAAVYLHDHERYTVKEISRMLGQDEEAVTALIRRGRQKLFTNMTDSEVLT